MPGPSVVAIRNRFEASDFGNALSSDAVEGEQGLPDSGSALHPEEFHLASPVVNKGLRHL